MRDVRTVKRIIAGTPTREGAGVHLNRLFGYHEVPDFDPFLLFDDFSSDKPEHYSKGFPWHPHRGIETITYVLAGEVDHGDSMGNSGTIGRGDVQWMTAGSGIIHQEMPRGDSRGSMHGFQLWANLPSSRKMMDPRYRDVESMQIPEVARPEGVKVRIIAGEIDGTRGPVGDVVTEPEYLDVSIPPDTLFVHTVPEGHTVFAYLVDGLALFDERLLPAGDADNRKRVYTAEQEGAVHAAVPVTEKSIILFNDGKRVEIRSGRDRLRLLLVSGKPIGEPVSWHGPIVMNTREEIKTALSDLEKGTFIRYRR